MAQRQQDEKSKPSYGEANKNPVFSEKETKDITSVLSKMIESEKVRGWLGI